MKHLLCSAVLFLSAWIVPQQLCAATVTVIPGSGLTEFAYAGGGTISNVSSYGVRVGYFTNAAAPAFAAGLSEPKSLVFDTIEANFVPLGEGSATLGGNFTWSISALSGAGAGKFSIAQSLNSPELVFTSSAPANTATLDGLPRGSRLFLLVYDNSDYTAATELGIFSAEEWLVPADPAISFTTLNLLDVDNSSTEIYRGTLGDGFLQLATVIPEPASGIFTLLAGLGIFVRRRR